MFKIQISPILCIVLLVKKRVSLWVLCVCVCQAAPLRSARVSGAGSRLSAASLMWQTASLPPPDWTEWVQLCSGRSVGPLLPHLGPGPGFHCQNFFPLPKKETSRRELFYESRKNEPKIAIIAGCGYLSLTKLFFFLWSQWHDVF